jgi:signal transduction histidine kinase
LVRFDDRLATVLARPVDRPADRVAQWRQLLDLLAQGRPDDAVDVDRDAFARLGLLRPDVPLAIRQETARAFAGRMIAAPLVAFLAADVPAVAGAILPQARLDQQGWLSILPRLSPTGRGFLRHRRDLGPVIEAALASFGATDMQISGATEIAEVSGHVPDIDHASSGEIATSDRLHAVVSDAVGAEDDGADSPPSPPVQALEHGVGEGQIRAIITRIARFRRDRDGGPRGLDPAPGEDAASFRFETGTDGLIRWLEGVPRGPLIGETIAVPASGRYGVDGQAPGAFRRRAPFRDARLVVAGDSTASGEWRIAGVPVFTPADGRFRGYRCTARRPRADERIEPVPTALPGLYDAGLDSDSLRQLLHELRTPLNAIGGFAEMIRRQMRGPASTVYRDRAQNIAEQAGRLLAAVDDLDVAARLETQRLDLQRTTIDLGAMLSSICADHAPAVFRRGALLECGIAPDLAPVTGDPAALRRMIGRLIACCAALADEHETIRVSLASPGNNQLELTIGHPHRLAGRAEEALLDPGYGPDGDAPDAPLLGLGFSLHLVRRLAAAAGGTMTIEADRFLLRLPAAADPSRVSTGG